MHRGSVASDVPSRSRHADRNLSLIEKQFLISCERGDFSSVLHYLAMAGATGHYTDDGGASLASRPPSSAPSWPMSFNINCVDSLGRTALHIAIENENIEIIELLLEHGVDIGDALLHAISEENVEAVEMILLHLEKNDKLETGNQNDNINEHSAFTPDITPIILAAHRDNYEIIKLLLDRGASISHPHDVKCDCKDCILANAEDSLRLSRSRMNAYRALASPSLICLSERDPIFYAFELSWELRQLSCIENEFKTEYVELNHKCQTFAVNLLDQTRGSKEMEILLNHETSDRWPIKERARGERMQLARLRLAIQFRQKRFVAHPNCQQVLASIWYEGLPGFRRRHTIFKLLLTMGVSFGFPILSLIYLIAPKSLIGQFVRKPFIKFLSHSASYVTFLFLLILASQRINYDSVFDGGSKSNQSNEDPDRKERRGPPPTPVEWAIMAWVMGLIWMEVKQLWDSGLYAYAQNMWNILDFITNSLYMTTIMLRFVAYVKVEAEIADPATGHLGRAIKRQQWDPWDPTLISESVFATANIFSSLKLVHIFTVNPHLGPLQISIGRMVIDILKFFFVYWLVLFSFACGLNQLFWYYATTRQKECNKFQNYGIQTDPVTNINLSESCGDRHFSFANLFNSLETLFWAIFGLVELDRVNLREPHYVTEWAGKTMFGSYGVISLVVLLNMLVAMMSNSYDYIVNQADVEWKFARSKLWIEYFEEAGTLPPPFNIIPSPKTICHFFNWLFEKLCQCTMRHRRIKQRSIRLQKILKAVSQKENNYQSVMRSLVKRYIAYVQRVKQRTEGVSEDDVNELKQDISAFRYDLLEILGNAGFDTGHCGIAQRLNGKNKRRTAQAERRLMKGFQSVNVHLTLESEQRVSEAHEEQQDRTALSNESKKHKISLNSSTRHSMELPEPIREVQCLAKRSASSPRCPNDVQWLSLISEPNNGLTDSAISKFRKLSHKIPLPKRLEQLKQDSHTKADFSSGTSSGNFRMKHIPSSRHNLNNLNESSIDKTLVVSTAANDNFEMYRDHLGSCITYVEAGDESERSTPLTAATTMKTMTATFQRGPQTDDQTSSMVQFGHGNSLEHPIPSSEWMFKLPITNDIVAFRRHNSDNNGLRLPPFTSVHCQHKVTTPDIKVIGTAPKYQAPAGSVDDLETLQLSSLKIHLIKNERLSGQHAISRKVCGSCLELRTPTDSTLL